MIVSQSHVATQLGYQSSLLILLFHFQLYPIANSWYNLEKEATMSKNHSVQAMIQLVQQDEQTISLITKFLSLPDAERREWFQIMKLITQEPEFNDLIKLVAKITPDPNIPTRTRQDTLSRIKKYVNTISRHDQMFKDPRTRRTVYRPKLKPNEIILVQFAGQGSEIHDLHYGIAWYTQDNRDPVTVIPTSSFKYDSTKENGLRFNIGKVGFLPGETVVLMADITTISRKRIQTSHLLNPVTKEIGFVSLDPDQVTRVQDGFRVLGLREQTLTDVFLQQDRFPVLTDYDTQISHMHRPYTIEPGTTTDVLNYTVSGDNTIYTIKKAPTTVSRKNRKHLILSWLNATGNDPLSREQNQKQAYQKMIQLTS